MAGKKILKGDGWSAGDGKSHARPDNDRAFMVQFTSQREYIRFIQESLPPLEKIPGIKRRLRFRLFAETEMQAFKYFRYKYGDSYNESIIIHPLHYDFRQAEIKQQNDGNRNSSRSEGRRGYTLFDLDDKTEA